jgi:uncharacterized membrane protein
MAQAAGALLLALTLPALLINLYFSSLILGRWPALRRALGSLFNACGADTSSCAVVARTHYARTFGGAPNVALGILWCLALASLAGYWIASGRLIVPWAFLLVAAGTLAVGAYLVHALVAVLRQPCPL